MSSNIYQPRKIMVTGGAGFIGANFIRYLLTHDEAFVLNLDALTYAGSLQNLSDLPNEGRYQFIKGDICDTVLIASLLEKHAIDTIVHFAAESHVDRSIEGPAPFIQTNIMGTFNLLEAARQQWLIKNNWGPSECRFHHISTDEVYGSLNAYAKAFTEEDRYAPNSPYSASKASSDHLVRAYAHTYYLPVTISHCSNNYGPYQHGEKFIPTIIRACLKDKPIPIYGDGSNIRDWLYVEDHCAGIDTILRRGQVKETYNLGGRHEMHNLALAHAICDRMDDYHPRKAPHRQLIHFVTDRPGHDWRYAVDASKVSAQLEWAPKETFDTGIQKTIEFYCKAYAG